MYIKNLTTIAFAILALTTAQAEQLSPAQALARAKSESSSPRRVAGKGLETAPVFTSKVDGLNALYVFNSKEENGGYAILSADDVAIPVLGYADSGSFDPANIPDNMDWWLSQYGNEIKWAIDNGLPSIGNTPRTSPAHPPIAPLLTARWNQGNPYNLDCPQMNGNQCVTGCVATAMAQIMYYHKWPQTEGSGSNSYEWNNTTLSMNFADVTFDWDNMTDSYGDDSTTEQKNAVAELMKACGFSTNMGYGVTESGTQPNLIAWALTEYFDYDKSIQYLSRNAYTLTEWESLIYNELAEKRPVQYNGRTLSNEGHAFVCDGYNDGYFHINWGWGGASDGYFLTSVLDPSNQGIGGAQSGMAFVTDQHVIVGIQKNKGTTIRQEPYMMLFGSFLPESAEYPLTGTVTLGGKFGNGGYMNFNGVFGLKCENTSGGEPKYVILGSINDLPPGYYYDKLTVNAQYMCSDLGYSEAEYIVSPVYSYNGGEWHDCVASASLGNKLKMSVTNDKLVFYYAPDEINLSIESVTPLSPLYIYREFAVKGTVSVQNEYNGTITPYFYEPGTYNIRGLGNAMHITVESGSREITYTGTLYRNNAYTDLPAGNYELAFADAKGLMVSDRIPVTLKENPGDPVLTFSDLHIVTGETAPKDNVQFAGKVTCTEGYFYDAVYGAIYPLSGGTPLTLISSEIFPLEAGETKEFVAKGPFADGVVDTRYFILPLCNNNLYQDILTYFTCTAAEESEIEPAGISLYPTTLELEVGKTAELTATIEPDNATLTDLVWAVDDTSVANVTDGIVTAIAPGSTTVSVTTSNGLTATCAVTVTDTSTSINGQMWNGTGNICRVIDGRIIIDSESEAEIYTASGRMVYRGTSRSVAVDAGVYIVRIGGNAVKVVVI